MSDIFNADNAPNDTPLNTNVDPVLDALVGEGRKYKTVADLAKAYDHVNGFAETLKAEKVSAETRATQAEARALAAQQLLELRMKMPDQSGADRGTDHTPQRSDPNVLDDEELESRITKVTLKREQESRANTNLLTVSTKLAEIYGDDTKASEAVKAKAAELGVSVEWLRSSAASSPAAFYSVMGVNPGTPTSVANPAPRSDVNPLVVGNNTMAKEGTFAFYEAIRKTDPKRYYNPKTQSEIHRVALEKGDSFYL